MSAPELISLGAAVTAVLWAFLVVLVVTRKRRRDVRERRSRARRERLWAALSGPDHELLLDAAHDAARSAGARIDLLAVLDRHPDLDRAAYLALQEATGESGLGAELERLTSSRDPVERGSAILLLGRIRLPDTVRLARPLLTDEDLDVRLTACAALAQAQSPEAARALIDALEANEIEPPRLIERLGDPWACEEIVAALSEPGYGPGTKAALIRALGLSAQPGSAAPLLPYLDSDVDELRISAARSLGEIGLPVATLSLIKALEDPRWEVRAQAARALGRIGEPTAAFFLVNVIGDPSWWVRANAGNALRALGPRGMAALRQVEETSGDRYARHRARESLALAAAAAAEGERP